MFKAVNTLFVIVYSVWSSMDSRASLSDYAMKPKQIELLDSVRGSSFISQCVLWS